jgi:hypothetical protein
MELGLAVQVKCILCVSLGKIRGHRGLARPPRQWLVVDSIGLHGSLQLIPPYVDVE